MECFSISPDGSIEQYDQVCRRLTNGGSMRSLSDRPGGGCLLHSVSQGPNGGLRVYNVWESPEAFQRFGETLGPIRCGVGTGGTPQVAPLHNFVNA